MAAEEMTGTSAAGSFESIETAQAVSIEKALGFAIDLHRSGARDEAGELYRRILEVAPDYPDALHYYGLFLFHTGQIEAALGLIRRAIALDSDQPSMHTNLGNILANGGDLDAAMAAYHAAIALDSAHVDANSNLGVTLRALGKSDEAEAHFRAAIAGNPKHHGALNNLARVLLSRGQIKEAIQWHAKALELGPRNTDTFRWLSAAYAAYGEFDSARSVLEEWAELEPASVVVPHLLSALPGGDAPLRASDAFVETVFDRFAASFDATLAHLDYQAPELVAAAVRDTCGEGGKALDVLDAGCGTGLCGALLLPYAARLTGVDLSSKMIERAGQRGCYDALVKAELTGFLREHQNAYDLVVSADTLCYFGALDNVLHAASGSLRKRGLLVFSVEDGRNHSGFRLNASGRYSHHYQYVDAALTSAGLTQLASVDVVLRQEAGQPVAGLVVTARKP